MGRPFEALLYGATGYTGRLIAQRLRDEGLRFALAGRSPAALEPLSHALNAPFFVAALDDAAALRDTLAQAEVVIAAAGPFVDTGPALQQAARSAKTHLLDLAGEPSYLLASAAEHDAFASAGVALVHSVGFDVLPSELLVWLCEKSVGPLVSLELVVAHTQSIPSHGTLRSLERMASGGVAPGLRYVDGAWLEEPLAHQRRVVELPAPFGARAAVSIPAAEVALFPRTFGVRAVTCFQATLAPSALAVAEKGLPQLARDSIRSSLEHLAQSGRRGPADDARAQSRFAWWCHAVGEGGERTMVMTGADPYGLSAALAVCCAQQVRSTPAERLRGVFTATQVFDGQRLLATLAQLGARWTTVR